MADKVYGFGSPGAIRRVISATKWAESRQGSVAAGRARKDTQQPMALVEITGPIADGLYPAKAVAWDDDAGEWVDLGEVRFKDANGKDSLDSPTKTLARYCGPASDGDYGLFVGTAVAPIIGGSFSMPTAWQIIPGDPCDIIPTAYRTAILNPDGTFTDGGASGPTTTSTLAGPGGSVTVNVGGPGPTVVTIGGPVS